MELYNQSNFLNIVKFISLQSLSNVADFLIDEKITIEIGGKGKTQRQIKNVADGYIIADDMEVGFKNKIPLWLLGFLY